MEKIIRFYIPLILIITFLFPVESIAQRKKEKPTWVNFEGRKSRFPERFYIIGFASENWDEKETESDFFDRLKGYSRGQLVESIYTNIKNVATTDIKIENEESQTSFKQSSVSFSKVNVTGLKMESFLDDKKNVGYVVAFAKKQDVSDLYKTIIANKRDEIQTALSTAKQHIKNNNNPKALEILQKSYNTFREVEEAQTLIIALENLRLNNPVLFTDEINNYKTEVDNQIRAIQNNKNLSIEDAAYFLAQGLDIQMEKIDKPIRLTNFTFQDTKVAAPFSKNFGATLEQKLMAKGVQVTSRPTKGLEEGNTKDKSYWLTGTYWEDGDNLKVIAVVRDMESGKTIASSESGISIQKLKAKNIKYKPDDFDETGLNSILFRDDVVLSAGGLHIDLATNKGKDNLIFEEGEELILYIKANKQCYVRFIYHLADGTRVLLYDNYFIPNNMCNKVIEIPQHFECAEPFGVESLQMVAQSKQFAPLNIKSEYGYDFIVSELDVILANTRGFKPKTNEDVKAEKSLIITTMAKQ